MTVIVLLADGVRADTLASGMDRGELPAMARLRAGGGMHEVTSAFPSVTGPAYTPFLMGRFPGSIGLPGLRWFDRSRETCSFPDYTRSYVGYQLNAVNTDIDPTAATIFELVPDSVAALSMITRGLPRGQQVASFTPRSAIRAAATHFRGDPNGWLQVDREVADGIVMRVDRDTPPPFVFAAFTGVDKMSHARGHASDGVRDALRIVDDTLGELDERLTRRGLRDRARVWITSDHGHSRVRRHEDLARLIAGLGYKVMAHPWVYRLGADVAVMVSGNAMAHVYVDLARRERPFLDGMSGAGRALADQLLSQASVDVMLVPLDASRCGVWSRTRGRATVSWSADGLGYHRDSGDPLGIGGDISDACPTLAYDATLSTDYPDSIVQIARLAGASRAGDLILSASRDWDFRARFEPIPHVSSHGALHREHMAVPLLIDRPAARTPRRTTDVFPSALAALGLPVPSGLDGESFV
jgi:hypothetical protein